MKRICYGNFYLACHFMRSMLSLLSAPSKSSVLSNFASSRIQRDNNKNDSKEDEDPQRPAPPKWRPAIRSRSTITTSRQPPPVPAATTSVTKANKRPKPKRERSPIISKVIPEDQQIENDDEGFASNDSSSTSSAVTNNVVVVDVGAAMKDHEQVEVRVTSATSIQQATPGEELEGIDIQAPTLASHPVRVRSKVNLEGQAKKIVSQVWQDVLHELIEEGDDVEGYLKD